MTGRWAGTGQSLVFKSSFRCLRDARLLLPSPDALLRVAGREPAPDLIRGRGWGWLRESHCEFESAEAPPTADPGSSPGRAPSPLSAFAKRLRRTGGSGEDTPPRSRDAMRPRFARNSRAFKRVRAQGMPDARCTRSFACKKEKTHAHLQGPPETNGIPCAMVLTAPPWSPWCTGLVSHHRLRELRPAS
jgi:hypothetical protein